MRKTALLIATSLLTAALTACSGSTGTAGSSAANAEQQEAAVSDATVETQNAGQASAEEGQKASQASTTEDEGGIDVDKGLMNVEITIPAESAEYYGFSFESQEEADAYAKEQGFKNATLGDDGSVTIVMSKSQHKKTMVELNKTIDEALQAMIGSENTRDVNAILAAQLKLTQRMAHPAGIHGYVKLGHVYITIKQASLVEWTLLTRHLCLDFT